jgi:two-component system, chemotaxis family, sensor kinase CheA
MNDEVIREFLLETHENLANLDADLLTLEKQPTEKSTLGRVFRTLHSVKGTAGFIGLVKLQSVAHSAESLLAKLRNAELTFNQSIATALLQVVDSIREVIANVEKNGGEGNGDYTELVARLEQLRTGQSAAPTAAVPPTPTAPPAATAAPAATAPPAGSALVKPKPAVPQSSLSIVQGGKPGDDAGPGDSSTDIRASVVADSSLRVDVGLLDKLMTLVGELVLARNQIVQFSNSQVDTAFLGTVQRLNLLTTELQTGVMKTRMQPIGNVWNKFPRIVRDLSVACGKQVRFDMDGQDTELDKTIIEAIRDPLTHMVRNAVDHGIEMPATRTSRGKPGEGRLTLTASHEGGKVVIEIADDGGGIDPQRVRDKAIANKLVLPEEAARMTDRELTNLVFLPGFSTADQVTNLSGRGVGMDVVRTNIERIGGSVDLESRPGQGTNVRMKIPLTLAIIPVLSISGGGERFCIPQVNLLELVRLEGEQASRGIEFIQGAPVYRLRGNLLPIVYLDQELGLAAPGSRRATDEILLVVLQADDRSFGLVVDAIHDTQEIVVKPLQYQLKGIPVYSGATILGDGSVSLILDVLGVAKRANVLMGKQSRGRLQTGVESREATTTRTSVLLFATAGGGRMAISLDQVARLEEFPATVIERLGRHDVVQYRGEILPIVHLADLFDEGMDRRDHNAPVQVVVHARAGRSVGIAIGRILDVVDEELATVHPPTRPSVQYTAVVQGKVAEFIDIDEVFRRAEVYLPPIPEVQP